MKRRLIRAAVGLFALAVAALFLLAMAMRTVA